MASISEIELPHGTIPTQMFGNVNLQNAMMYVNENFAAVKDGVNDAVTATNEAIAEKADADHDHDDDYAALEHTHAQSDVIGLQSALDGKAELNHEHSQYLSSLPTHYHDVTGIQGLGEQLQAKAEKTHSHTIAQVENLATELGVKASTAYVDQKVSAVSSSIKTIADEEVKSFAADKGDASTAGDVPIDSAIAPDNETIAQKNARVGTSNKYARADHKHALDTETDSSKLDTSLVCDGNGTNGAASFGTSTKIPRIDHSHPLNYPDGKPTTSIAMDGAGANDTALFGDTNYYADLGHSHPLNVAASGTPSDCVKSTGAASSGSSGYYARQDHVHKIPSLGADDITYSGTTTVGDQIDTNISELNDHEVRISTLESQPGGVTSVNGKTGAVTLDADDVGALDEDDIGDSVQEHSTVLDAIVDGGHYDTTDGGHEITGGAHYVASASSNARILGVNANSTGVSLNDAIGTDMVSYDGTNTLDSIVDSSGDIDGTSHVCVGSVSDKWVKTTSGGKLTVSSDNPIIADSSSTGYIFNSAGTVSYKSYKSGTTTVTVVTGLSWTGTNLVAAKSRLTFTDGILTGVAATISDSIGTVTYNP